MSPLDDIPFGRDEPLPPLPGPVLAAGGPSGNGAASALDRAPRRGLAHAEVLALEVKRSRQLIRGLVEQGTVGVIAGLPESYKTWLALNACLAVAGVHGRVLGRQVVEHGPVGYFWQDDSTDNEASRVKVYSARHDVPTDTPITWHLNEGWVLPDDLAEIRDLVEERRQRLVAFDSVYNFTPAGSNLKDEEVSDIVKQVKAELCDLTGCTVLLVDHAGWPTEANRTVRVYGSVFKTAAIRWGIYLRADGTRITLEARGNNMPRVKQTLTWDEGRLQLQVVDVDATRKGSPADIAEWIRTQPGEQASPKAIRDEFDIGEDTLKRRRDDLERLGVAYISEGKNSRYSATAELPPDSHDRGVSRGELPDPAIPPPTYVVGEGSRGAPRQPDRGAASAGSVRSPE